MKQLQFITVFCVIIVAMSCHRGNSIMISNGNDNLTINYSGDIKFNDEETTIASISRNGFLKYQKNDKKLFAENDLQGGIKYEMYNDGNKLDPGSEQGKLFLADVVKSMVDVGFDAKGRMERIYKKGGSRAVLNEVGNLKDDYIISMYIEFLFAADSVSQNDIKEIAKKIGNKIGSDYEKG